jgi:hypothetical protein
MDGLVEGAGTGGGEEGINAKTTPYGRSKPQQKGGLLPIAKGGSKGRESSLEEEQGTMVTVDRVQS